MQVIDRATIETWLAGVLMERQPAWPFAPGEGVKTVIDIANAEGVAALLQARLRASGLAVPDALHAALDSMVRIKAAQSLYRQAQCRAVLARLDSVKIPALVLKGSALAYWAYAAPHLRDCGDIDLLLPSRESVQRAVKEIAPLGYSPPGLLMPGDLVQFETACVHNAGGDGLEIDLHWRLSNVPLFAFRFDWEALWAEAIALPALAPGARGLAPPLAMLHACMHRVKHLADGQDRMKWLYDLVVMAHKFGDSEWSALREYAIARGLAGVCVRCLQDAEARFGKFAPVDCMEALAAASRGEALQVERIHNHWYCQRMNWRAFPTTRMRWRWLWQQLFPGAAYLRQRYGARGGVIGALWQRLRRGLRWMRG